MRRLSEIGLGRNCVAMTLDDGALFKGLIIIGLVPASAAPGI
ncbi:hypothetical protein FOPG_09127 [Fusarium oxysporum f. sp. conglutinans race 2 54008]|uniref:Uncharacterized protein n=1 Tax=Fusarium oxysporum f. sp. conglutinans race 2 54008 TaxID=1089457 RepID=X0HHZ0_FUSOX|nr:hypothetical protein FOPG_09127 [Fusarium oxysporum f. sp. conglutinans race 2 54008]